MINTNLLTTDYLKELALQTLKQPAGMGHPIISKHGDSWSPYYRFLYAFVKTFKPDVAVECGVYQGIGSCHMAMADPDLLVVGIDIAFHENVSLYTQLFPNINLVIGDTVGSVSTVEHIIGDKKIGLLFLDSTHVNEVPMAEFTAYKHLFDDVCIIACDDIAIPELAKFWEWLPGDKIRLDFLHPRLYETYTEPGFGVSIVRK